MLCVTALGLGLPDGVWSLYETRKSVVPGRHAVYMSGMYLIINQSMQVGNNTGKGNPRGLRVRVPTGTGPGCLFGTREKPVPVSAGLAGTGDPQKHW
jgi:hypothetical protein